MLRGNYAQTQALSLARAQAPAMLDVHDRLMRGLEHAGRLDRALEALPDDETVAERRAAGRGLTQPELAGAPRLQQDHALRGAARLRPARGPRRSPASSRATSRRRCPSASATGMRRAPPAARDHRHARDERHGRPRRARRSCSACSEETGAAPSDIARAYAVARDVFAMRVAVGGGRGARPPGRGRRRRPRCCSRAAGSSSARRAGCCATAAARSTSPRGRALRRRRAGGRRRAAGRARARRARGVEARVARAGRRRACRGRWPRASRAWRALFSALDIVEVAAATRASVERRRRRCTSGSAARLQLHWLRDRITALPRDDRWQAMARAALRDDLFTLHAELTADVLRADARGEADVDARIDALDRRQPRGRRPLPGDARRHPHRRHVRPHDAAGRAARGAQPDQAPAPVSAAG